MHVKHTLLCWDITDRNLMLSVDATPPILLDMAALLFIHDEHYCGLLKSPPAEHDVYTCKILSLRPKAKAAVMCIGDKAVVLSSEEFFYFSQPWLKQPHKAFKDNRHDRYRVFEKSAYTEHTRASEI